MNTNVLGKTAKALIIGSLLAFASISLQACNDQAKEVKTTKTLKSNCKMKCGADMKCKSGKCGNAKATKPTTGKCGDAKKVTPAMKCQAGKCGQGK